MTILCSKCGVEFEARTIPCPEKIIGCLVAHYDKKSFICPECGYDTRADIRKAWSEGNTTTEIGTGIGNIENINFFS